MPFTVHRHRSLLLLGGLLALYDWAEVLLEPIFGSLTDRIGARPVLLGGLVAFSLFSAVFALAYDTALLWAARLGQGAAASAFSAAASALAARLNPQARHRVRRHGRRVGADRCPGRAAAAQAAAVTLFLPAAP